MDSDGIEVITPEELPPWLSRVIGSSGSPGRLVPRFRREGGRGLRGQPAVASPEGEGPPRVFFLVVVDPDDLNEAWSLHAISAPEAGSRLATWWSFGEVGWCRDDDGELVDDEGWLLWTDPESAARFAESFLEDDDDDEDEDDGGSGVPTRAELRERLTAALDDEDSDSFDLAEGYLQWAGFPGGLHLEVGDGNDYSEPFDEALLGKLRMMGWRAPNATNRNAWYEVIGPDAVDVAFFLVMRTTAILGGDVPA